MFCKKTLFNSLAVQYCDELLGKPYVPSIWAFSPRIHSTYFALKPKLPSANKTEYLEMRDGRLIGISWPKLEPSTGITHRSPVVMFIPNPISSDNSIQPFIENAIQHGFRPSIFLHRNSKCLPRLRHASESKGLNQGQCVEDGEDWKDLAEAILYVANNSPLSSLYLISLSYGSTTLLKFLAYDSRSRFLKGVASVSPVWSALNYPYVSLKPLTGQSHANGDAIKHSVSHDSFFHRMSRRRRHAGHRESFQRLSTTLPIEVFAKLKKLAIPMLMIFSRDDPLLSSDSKYRIGGAWKNSDLLLVVETASGGHAGFMEGLTPESWAAKLVFLYFEAVDKFKKATIG